MPCHLAPLPPARKTHAVRIRRGGEESQRSRRGVGRGSGGVEDDQSRSRKGVEEEEKRSRRGAIRIVEDGWQRRRRIV